MTIDEFARRLSAVDKENAYQEILVGVVKQDLQVGIVFGLTHAHDCYRTELYRYRYFARDLDREYVDSRHEDQYTKNGYGWHISSMHPGRIIVDRFYKPDRYDKDVFLFYKVDFQDL